MEGDHANQMPVTQQEMHDAGYQAYQAAYMDPPQAQALANYMPEFAGMDSASQMAAAVQHYAQMPQPGAAQHQLQQSETESDLEEGMDPAQQRLTISAVDAQATKGDEAWTDEEEQELLALVNNEAYRKEKLGDTTTKWAPIAQAFSRTVKAVKRKYDKLTNPDKEQRKMRRLSAGGEAGGEDSEGQPPDAAGDASAAPHQMYADTVHSYPAQMTDDQMTAAEAAAAMQVGAGMTAEQMAAMYAGYGWQGYDPVAGGEQDPNGAQMDPMMLQQLAAYQQHQPLNGGGGGTAGSGSLVSPRNDRVFWKQDEQQELLRIVQDAAYRVQRVGCADVNWDVIAKHLGRGKRSVQRKYDNLKGAGLAEDGTLVLPANDGKKWSADEVTELVRLVEDGAYRQQVLQMDKVDWRQLGQHFMRSYESVSYKYSYVKNTGRTGGEGKPKHAKAKHETSYKEMAIWALQQIGGEGTSGQICNVIATNPAYAPQLDTAIVSGKKTLQRWKHGVRSALNAFLMFDKTARIFEGEVVWHLVEEQVQQEMAAAQEKAARQRNKPLSGAQRRKLKKAQQAPGEGGEGQEEEGAQQALAQMAAGRPAGGRKRKADSVEQQQGVGGVELALEDNVHLSAEAAAAGGMAVDPAQLSLMVQGQMPLLQSIYDPNAPTLTAEQLNLMQPEQLAMLPPQQLELLQQQMQAGHLSGSLQELPPAMPAGGTADGQPADEGHHHHHHYDPSQHAQQQYDPQQQQYDPQQQGYDPQQHYDPAAAHHVAQHYQQQYDAQQQQYDAQQQQQYDPQQHDAAAAAAMAAQQQQYAEQYGAGTYDPAAAGHLSGGSVVQGVQLGQPVGGAGLDMSLAQPVQTYDHYGQYYGQQYYGQQYDPSQYAQGVEGYPHAAQQAAAYQQQYASADDQQAHYAQYQQQYALPPPGQ